MELWQARASEFHPYLVASMDELPAELRSLVEAELPDDAVLVSGFVVPANYRADAPEGEPCSVPAQVLVFTGDGMWHVQAPGDDALTPAPLYIDPDAIRWIRSSHLLLHGRLEIAAAVRSNPVRLDVEFNAVGWRQKDQNWRSFVARSVGLTPVTGAAGLTPVPGAAGLTPNDQERALLEGVPGAADLTPNDRERALLEGVPEKFVDGLFRYGLYTGEVLQAVTFQPAVWQHHLMSFDEQVVPDTLVALTSASVLILSEEKAFVRRSDELGLLITRIARRAIVGLQVEPGTGLDEVIFVLSWAGVNDDYRISLAHDSAQLWFALWTQG